MNKSMSSSHTIPVTSSNRYNVEWVKMLCIPQQIVEAAHSGICDSLFKEVVQDAIASGADGYDAEIQKAVRKATHGQQPTREVAMSIANRAVVKIFINYIKRA